MRIKEGLGIHDVCGEHVVMAVGEGNIDFTKLISLNGSAACVWNAVVGKDFTLDTMVEAVMAEYDVDEDVASNDCQQLLTKWIEAGLVI